MCITLPNNYSVKIETTKIISHLKIMNNLRWIDFAGEGMKPAVDFMKDEVRILCKLLTRHKDKLSINLREKAQDPLNPLTPSRKNAVSVAFKDSLRTVSITDNEFHTVIDHRFAIRARKKGRESQFKKRYRRMFGLTERP